MPFDLETAIPVQEKAAGEGQEPGLTRQPGFDFESANSATVDEKGMTGYEHFVAGQLDAQVKAAIQQPIDESQIKHIQDAETKDPGAFQSFAVPYTEGIVGFFTKPFGVRPDLSRPFGLTKGPKGSVEQAQDQVMAEKHPIATTLGQIVSGVAPFIATAPFFPQTLLGTLATFETVGLAGKIGEQQTDESLMTPVGTKAKELGIEALKSGIMAPIWHYSGLLKFIGRPYLSAITRAGVRGAGQATLSAVFGTDLAQALKEGGTITALSLIFEAPTLAKTALGRGIINNLNAEAARRGLGEGKLTINVDKLDAASTRSSIFNMVNAFYNTMAGRLGKSYAETARPTPQDRFLAPSKSPAPAAETNAPIVTLVPPKPWGPAAGGLVHVPEQAPIFYSKMMASLAEKMPESATPEQVQGIIKSAGISPDEVDMSNLGDFLKGKNKISKPELLDYLKQNQVTIEEVVKSDAGVDKKLAELEPAYTQAKTELTGIEESLGNKPYVSGQPLGWMVKDANGNPTKLSDTLSNKLDALQEPIQAYEKYMESVTEDYGVPSDVETKFRQYVLPGGEKYREVLFKLPYSESKQADYLSGKSKAKDTFYKSPHWAEPNVLAHARLTDRTTADGKKVLFVEEIQSDWARELRKFEQDKEKLVYSGQGFKPTPSHPLLKKWQELILKRLLYTAAEQGYDYLSWTTGGQQAERYDLSKQVDTIKYRNLGIDKYEVEIIKDGKVIESKAGIDAEGLNRYVGKDVGKKIIERATKRTNLFYSLEGKDLKIGGEWAINLYDQQIPNFLNDYVKKFGAQVEAIKIPGKIEAKNLWIEAGEPDVNGDSIFYVYAKKGTTGEPLADFETQEEAAAFTREYKDKDQGELIQQAIPITEAMKDAILYHGQPIFGKSAAEIGKPGTPNRAWQHIFRMQESTTVINTRGEKINLPKGEEYHTMNVYDNDGNIVPGKVILQDGKQVTVYDGELNKLKGMIVVGAPMAGGRIHKKIEAGKAYIQRGEKREPTIPVDLFINPTHDVELPGIPQEILDQIGKESKPVILKKNIIEKNNKAHPDLGPKDSATIIDAALYHSDEIIQSKPKNKPNYFSFISKEGVPKIAVVEFDENKEGIEIVSWYYVTDEKKIEALKEKSEREGGHFLITKDRTIQGAADLSALTSGGTKQSVPLTGDLVKSEGGAQQPPKEPPPTAVSGSPEDEPYDEADKAQWEKEIARETQAKKDELKDYLTGKLKAELKDKGEYADLKYLTWLFAKEGGTTPDTLTELFGMGFDVGDPGDVGFDGRVLDLIRAYFNEDIQAKSATAMAKANVEARRENRRITDQILSKSHREIARALRIRDIEAARMVDKIGRELSRPLAKSKVKKLIREATGIIKIGDLIREDEALKRLMQREQSVSKESFRAGREVGTEAQKAHQAEIKQRQEDREVAKDEINGLIDDIRKVGEHLGVMPVEYQDTVKEILSQYDLKKHTDKTLAARDSMRVYVERMTAENEEVNIPEDQLAMLEKTTLNDMTVDDLRAIHDTVMRLYHQGKLKNQLVSGEKFRDLQATIEQGVVEITKGEGLSEENNIVKILKEQNKGLGRLNWEGVKNFIAEHLRPEVLIEALDGWKKGINTAVIWNPLFEAFKNEQLSSEASFQKIKKIMEPLDIKNAYTKKYVVGQFKEPGMTKANAYFVYANSFNEHNYDTLLNTGFTEADIVDVENFLSAGEKGAIQDLLKYYAEEQYQALDKVYIDLNGTHMSKEEFYFPILNLESKNGMLKDLEDQVLKRFRFKNAAVATGFTKGRVNHKSGYQGLDFFGSVTKNWEQVHHYMAYAPVIRDVRKYVGSLDIKKAIDQKFGKAYYDILQKFIKDVAYGGDQALLTESEKLFQRLRTNYMKAVLSINLLSALRQTMGVLPAMQFVGKVAIQKSMLKYTMNPVRWWKFCDEKSPLCRFRAFSTEREMKEILAMRSPEQRLQKYSGATKLTEYGMLPMIYTDKVISHIVWMGAYDSVIARGGTESDAVAFGDEALRRTQNMGDLIFLPDVFRAGSLWKGLTIFKNENNQNFNLQFENIMKTKEGQQNWMHFISGVLFFFLIPALLYGWSVRKRLAENGKEILNDLAGQGLGGFIWLGDGLNLLGGKTQGGINPMGNFLGSAAGIVTAKKPETKIDNAIKTLAFYYGLPYIGIKRLLAGQPLGKSAKGGTGNASDGIRPIYR